MITTILSNLKYIIIGLVVIMAIVVALRYPNLRTAVLLLCAVGFVVGSCFAINQIVTYYTISGQTYGEVNSIFDKTQTEFEKTDDYTFEFKNFGLQSTGIANQFQARATDTHKIDIDLSKNDWAIFVNETLLTDITSTSSTLSGKLKFIFNDTNDKEIKTDALIISISFEENTTDIVLTTNGGDIAVNLWNNYLSKNGFKLELKKTEPSQKNNTIIFDEEPTESDSKENSYKTNEFESTSLQFDIFINRNLYDKYKFNNQLKMSFKDKTTGFGGVGELMKYSLINFSLEYVDETNEYYHFKCSTTNYGYEHFILNFCLTATDNYSDNNSYAFFKIGGSKSLNNTQYSIYLNDCTFKSECTASSLVALS